MICHGTRFVEALELRRFLSGSEPQITLDDGLLLIQGTAGDDELYVTPAPQEGDHGIVDVRIFYKVDGQLQTIDQKFSPEEITSIRIEGGAGDDYIAVGGQRSSPVYQDDPAVATKLGLKDGRRVVSGNTLARRVEGERIVSGRTLAHRPQGRIVSGKTLALRPHERIVSGLTLARRILSENLSSSGLTGDLPIPHPGDPPVDGWGDVAATIVGGDGDDHISGSGANDTIDGGAGNDVITGFGGDDSIDGGDGNDVLLGGGGNDTIEGGAGEDTVAGNNFYYLTLVHGRDGDGHITSGETYQVPIAEDGSIDVITGGDGADTFHRTDQDDVIDFSADDTLSGLNIKLEDRLL
jgi:Ca2+-binding RTX toxin-like protein